MKLRFTKMQALGNDFVVLDGVRQQLALSPEQFRYLADRRRGVGCDQVLIVEPANAPDVDFGYRIHNADGSQVGQCGNGARCLARFVREQGLSDAARLRVATQSTRMELEMLAGDRVRVLLPPPEFAPARIPLRRETEADRYVLGLGGERIEGGAVSVGNPHFVIPVEDLARAPVARWGEALSAHPDFPEGANIGFVQRLDGGRLKLRVYERGVGETPACGSGACAAAVVMQRWRQASARVIMELTGGELVIDWAADGGILMEGPAMTVFEGEMEL